MRRIKDCKEYKDDCKGCCYSAEELLFEVEREMILHTVKLDSYYVGDMLKGGEETIPASKMQASDSNDDILNGFIDSAAGMVSDVLTGLLSSVRLEREKYVTEKRFNSIRFEYYVGVPITFDANQSTAILTAIKDVMVNYTLWQWYKRTNPTVSDQYRADMDEAKSKLLHRINQRTRPVRRPVRPMGF
jgi:hypothetical protein